MLDTRPEKGIINNTYGVLSTAPPGQAALQNGFFKILISNLLWLWTGFVQSYLKIEFKDFVAAVSIVNIKNKYNNIPQMAFCVLYILNTQYNP